MTIILSQCFNCINYDRFDNEKHSCRAFPDGIPEKVFTNEIEHKKFLKGQIGDYLFEEKS